MDSTDQDTDRNGEQWQQQQSLKDLQREVERQATDQEWVRDALKEVREATQDLAKRVAGSVRRLGKRQQGTQKTLDKIYLRIALLIGAVAGFCLLFGYFMGNIFPWLKP